MEEDFRQFKPSKLLSYARNNDSAAIEHAVVHLGAHVSFANRIGQTALHIGAAQGSVEAIYKLVALGLNPNVENVLLQTPLHLAAAAHKNAFEACSALLDLGADPFAADLHGRFAYEIAKDAELKSLLGAPDPRLYSAASEGNTAVLQQLFADGTISDPCSIGSDGFSPLHLAVRGGHIEAAIFLIDRGALVDQRELSTGDTAVHLAVHVGHVGLLSILSRRGADINKRNFHISRTLAEEWDPGDAGPLHQAPLHVGVDECNEEMVRTLLDLGATPDCVDFAGLTPLHYAMEASNADITNRLLHGGANPNTGCDDFHSPLHWAAQRGDEICVRYLIQYGGDVNAADGQRLTPLMLAVREGEALVVPMLLDAGANVGAINLDGDTSLHLAAATGNATICILIVEGASSLNGVFEMRNIKGKTAAEVATMDTIRFLFMKT